MRYNTLYFKGAIWKSQSPDSNNFIYNFDFNHFVIYLMLCQFIFQVVKLRVYKVIEIKKEQ